MTLGFYAEIAGTQAFRDVLTRAAYHPVPDDWAVVITDVRGSTAAIEAGRYKDVNALGVGSIVAVRNALDDLDLPYVFGGDGATLLCPLARREELTAALQGLKRTSREAFALEMRAGIVPVSALQAAGAALEVARFSASEHASFAMFAGSGFGLAERWVKDPARAPDFEVADGAGEADFTGFECRWRPIVSRNGLVLSVLVDAIDLEVHRRVLGQIEELLAGDGRPVAEATLRLAPIGYPFDQESRLLGGAPGSDGYRQRQRRARAQAQIGAVLMKTGLSAGGFDGKRYRHEVIANTDFRKYDEMLRMVLDLTPMQRDAIRAFLETERAAGTLRYGLHESSEALMTCAIGSYAGDHIHFVDGAAGGYALAAKQLKAQALPGPRVDPSGLLGPR